MLPRLSPPPSAPQVSPGGAAHGLHGCLATAACRRCDRKRQSPWVLCRNRWCDTGVPCGFRHRPKGSVMSRSHPRRGAMYTRWAYFVNPLSTHGPHLPIALGLPRPGVRFGNALPPVLSRKLAPHLTHTMQRSVLPSGTRPVLAWNGCGSLTGVTAEPPWPASASRPGTSRSCPRPSATPRRPARRGPWRPGSRRTRPAPCSVARPAT